MKKIRITLVIITLLLLFLCTFSVFGAVGQDNSAITVPGGEITNESTKDDIKAIFGGNADVTGTANEKEIKLTKNIKLASPIVIKSGSYKLIGQGSAVFRGFNDGALFVLDGSEGSSPKLTFLNEKIKDWSQTSSPELTLNGNKEAFPSANGSLISVKGNATLDFSGMVLFENAANTDFGGAISIYTVPNGNSGYFSPSVTLKHCKITDCASLKGGGGIALFGGNNKEGSVNLSNIIFDKNYAQNENKNGSGGAIYSLGGEIIISDTSFTQNKADLGGAVYNTGFMEIKSSTAKENLSTVSGGAIYNGKNEDKGIIAALTVSDLSASYNTAGGNGGAITNDAIAIISGLGANDNKAGANGGCVYNTGSFGYLQGSISNNKAEKTGGGLYNGKSGIFIMSDGEISYNDASLCGGVYSEGTFDFKGGRLGKNAGSIPQTLIKGSMKISGEARLSSGEVLGILAAENGKIEVSGKLTLGEDQKVAFFKEVTGKDGSVTGYKIAGKVGMPLFSGEPECVLSAVERFSVYSKGFKAFNLKSDGTLGFKAPFMPLWAWILVFVGIAGATVTGVFVIKYFKRKKKANS